MEDLHIRRRGNLPADFFSLACISLINVNLVIKLLAIKHLVLFRSAKGFGFLALRKSNGGALKNSPCLSSPQRSASCEF